MKQNLNPSIEDIKLECVLVQAWKKASAFIRYHNWYSDTLELDYQSLRLPQFIHELQMRLDGKWETTPLRVVPAPKSQKWILEDNVWKQRKGENLSKKIRPLAHVALDDQILSTAIMLCLANHVETLQGDPSLDITKPENRSKVISYGNRLFCDYSGGVAKHRWGSSKLYRKYFTDYQTFLERPGIVADEISEAAGIDQAVAIVHCDLSKFYDRVRPVDFIGKIKKHCETEVNAEFIELISSAMKWSWMDHEWAREYGETHNIDGFLEVALPQGLVASGFFANLFLIGFDQLLKDHLGKVFSGTTTLVDACRYVDDLRLVLTVPKDSTEDSVKGVVSEWVQELLTKEVPGLEINTDKTKVIIKGREEHFLVPQSNAARRIQHDVSGTFDMLHGTELIGAIEGFFYTQKRYSHDRQQGKDSSLLIGMSDVRDDTASRFAAGKFRRTFRFLRPILDNEDRSESQTRGSPLPKLVLSKEQLDEKGRLFSAMLIEEWVTDPSNVRLLRIAFDMFPDHEFLEKVLKLLQDGWQVGGCKTHRKDVKLYCLSEIFRAGATETGLVRDGESLPDGVDLEKYHGRLIEEGIAILNSPSSSNRKRCPWYLVQQIYLYLIARNAIGQIQIPQRSGLPELSLYYRFGRFLMRSQERLVEPRSVFTVLAVQCFGHTHVCDELRLSADFLKQLARLSPDVAEELLRCSTNISKSVREESIRLGLNVEPSLEAETSLPQMAARDENPFWEEENLVKLAFWVADYLSGLGGNISLTPWQIECTLEDSLIREKDGVRISNSGQKAREFFNCPSWAQGDDKLKFLLGQTLRFALRGSLDFSHNRSKCTGLVRAPRYSVPKSHWLQSQHGGYHGRTAFAPEWIALSSWMEDFLFELLRWPGCGPDTPLRWGDVLDRLCARKDELKKKVRGTSSNILFLEQRAPVPGPGKSNLKRPFRVGLVQSVIPNLDHYSQYSSAPELNDPVIRRKHRQHLTSIMDGINQMLHVRETHRNRGKHDRSLVDVLVMPELSVHPDDVDSILVPFVRRHRCIILAGLVYHPRQTGSSTSLINTALWIVPEWTEGYGLQIRKIEQGKWHITDLENKLSPAPIPFRPAQWLIGYEWSPEARPLYLTASVCYDSTDISLAADLRIRSDMYAVCALNKDVGTFDRMSEGLHYHMYQGMLVANNGEFGGSSCYMPFGRPERRQILHLHGQPQAQIAFVEIDPEKVINRGCKMEDKCENCVDSCSPCIKPNRKDRIDAKLPHGIWKTPPAGWESF